MKNNSIEYKHPNTVWEYIKRDIELMIIRGTLKNADKTPSISEIAEIYNIGKSTAKKVLEEMFNEGTLTKQQGVGYFVKPYVKEKLRSKRVKELEDLLDNFLRIANDLQIEKSILREMIVRKIKEIYID